MDLTAKIKNIGKKGSKEEKRPILNEKSDPEKGYQETSNDKLSSAADSVDVASTVTQENYFDDGVTKIDYVLVYEEGSEQQVSESQNLSEKEKEQHKLQDSQQSLHKKWRHKFIKHLRRTGVKMEMHESKSSEKTVYYVKLNCPWELLLYYAEELNLRAPLQLRTYKHEQWSSSILRKLRVPNWMRHEVPNVPRTYFTCTFKKSKLHKFLGSDDHRNYFSNTDRSRIAYEVLQTTLYGKKKRAELGIDRLLAEGVFTAAFPLHVGPFECEKNPKNPSSLNERQVLYEYWARWGRWCKYQPLDHIRQYFGEKIGIYFAWLGFYTAWLLPVAMLGLLIFIVGVATMNTNTPAVDICNSGNSYTMCPLCTYCTSWQLNSTCLMAKLSYLFDNGGTVFFATLMSFWAVFFLEFWKRTNAMLSHHWDVMNFEEEEERPRPEYNARAPTLEVNPITGVMEPHFPSQVRTKRIVTGFAILLIMLAVVLIFVLSVILYRGIIGVVLIHSKNHLIHQQASMMQSFSASILNLILIMLMANVYTAVAEWLTKWEMHRTQTEYEDALTFKVFIFQFVNYYSSIFYIAFFKGKLVGYPGHYQKTLGIRNESCGSGGCLIELAQQLFVIMVGKQAINNVQELVIPKLKQWWQRRKLKNQGSGVDRARAPWERDYEDLLDFEGLFDEYLEMADFVNMALVTTEQCFGCSFKSALQEVLQFGFITIFVAAFPLAPLFALLNNWIEIRLDARKLICEVRRPVAERAQDIGVWYDILDAIVQIAVITNAFLIAFTSEFIPRLLYRYAVGEGTLQGYTNFTLSYAPEYTNLGDCRYKAFRDRDGERTLFYYQLLGARLAFVIVFEHLVFFIGRMIDWGVPDVPESLQLKIKRENFLAKQALTDNIEASRSPAPDC